ncbi:MAG TPA: energy transducer TonB [Terriglobia bacterium]|nr:energy transducer TonB [Terriglobia bacterium]
MRGQDPETTMVWRCGTVLLNTCFLCVLLAVFAVPLKGIAGCSEQPTVWMDESTAASHLLTSRKFVFPAVVPVLAQIRSVTVIATVGRKGEICGAKAEAGGGEFREAAENIVKTSWRFRPFLLDRKPVVAQFPVTVNFVLSVDRQDVRAPEMAWAISAPERTQRLPLTEPETARA